MNFGAPRPEVYVPRWENGRVTGLSGKSFSDMPMTADAKNQQNDFQHIATKGIITESPLSALFFSKPNMQQIQNRIRYEIWKKTDKKHVIGEQSYIELEIVMRSVFLQFGLHLKERIQEQVERLNQLVIDWCVQKILVELYQHISYLDQVQTNPVPLDLPQNMSSTGTKMLRSITSTF